MEQQQRSLIFTAAVGLIILAIIVGSIYYLVKFIQGRVASNRTPENSVTEIAEDFAASPTGEFQEQPEAQNPADTNTEETTAPTQNQASDKKAFNGGVFQLTYPNNWGVLKCNNSQNFEFDPNNPADSTIACDVATKPVTVIVGDVQGCEGQTTKIGNIDVVKSQASEGNYTKYQWCTKTTPVLNITHRVSQGGQRATSKQDFSRVVEEIISSMSVTRGS